MNVLLKAHDLSTDIPDFKEYQSARIQHWNKVASSSDRGWGRYYHKRLIDIYKYLIPPGKKVIEIGCGCGNLLAALKPSYGVGVDFSIEMINRARKLHSELEFIQADGHEIWLDETFDFVILSDLVNDLWDVQVLFESLSRLVHSHSRIILNFDSRLWQPILSLARTLRLARPTLFQNWLTISDVAGMLDLAGFELVRHWEEILWPLKTPFLHPFCNRFLVKIWPFSLGALTNFIIARPQSPNFSLTESSVSVIVPARNEAGNISEIISRTPKMGIDTELVFVEGYSSDNTYEVIQHEIKNHPERKCRLIKQTGIGKGDAVRLGFAHASGDIFMILDADLTVPPEDLQRFYRALCLNKGEFINGIRLVYPMDKQAMRFINLLGNKFFGLAFSWLLGVPIKDTLCGTKVLWRRDYELISENRNYFGDFDPFGDFDLLFGAAKLGLKILDLPIRYKQRKYGKSNIQRWKHGWLLFRMLLFAAKRIKFV